jgi:ATP-dependent DNA helicase RecQ
LNAPASAGFAAEDAAADLLRSVFGHEGFRPGQDRVVRAVLAGRDTLAVMPTGGGKSLCYQVPALLGMPHNPGGVVLVVCPLVSLMKDQRESLTTKLRYNAAGVPDGVGATAVATLHASLSAQERREAESRVLSGEARILLAAPERLRSLEFCLLLKRAALGAGVSLVVVDEAHCISEWGHDFRPDYLFVGEVARDLAPKGSPRPPILALTATADPRVRSDVVSLLGLGEGPGQDHEGVLMGFDRPNLRYSVEEISHEGSRLSRVLGLLEENERPAIVYAHTRRQTEELAQGLRASSLPGPSRCEAYHAGLKATERDRVQERFMRGETDVICATVAFGMGIDKPNVRTVVHASLPASLSAYVQEAGRAGRDGMEASCTVLYAPGEMARRRGLVAAGTTPLADALRFFDALRARAAFEAAAGEGPDEAPARLDLPEAELFALGGVPPKSAQDAFAALEATGRVKRRYNLWATVRARRTAEAAAAGVFADAGSPAGRLLASLPAEGSGAVPLRDVARRAGVAPPTAQVLLARLKALGLAEVKGAGTAADVLVKTRPLSDQEIADLEARLLAHARSSTLHLDAIEDYARGSSCRRQRIIDHFEGPGTAPVVAPCGTCDVCKREAGSRTSGEVGGSYRPFGGFMRRLWGLISPLKGDPKGAASGGRTAAVPSRRAA